MKNKIIFWGNVKEGEKVHLVSWDGETGSQYHKINKTLVEYVVVATKEQLRDELKTRKPVIFCMEAERALDLDWMKERCQHMLFIPQMAKMELNQLFTTALFSNKTYFNSGKRPVLAGAGENAGELAMEILKHFQFVEKAKSYRLLLGGARTFEVDELSVIEDVVKEYTQAESSFYIEQIVLEEKPCGFYYMLDIETE